MLRNRTLNPGRALTLFVTLLCPALHPSSNAREPAHRIIIEGVPNFGEVTPELYRGGQPTPKGFAQLAKMGVAIVVDFRLHHIDEEKREVTKEGMKFVAIPWNCRHPTDQVIAQFLELLRANRGKKIFFHCHHGVDRTGLAAATYRIAEQGWTRQRAMKEMGAFGYNVAHRIWCHGLESYEQEFPERFETDPAFNPIRATSPPRSTDRGNRVPAPRRR